MTTTPGRGAAGPPSLLRLFAASLAMWILAAAVVAAVVDVYVRADLVIVPVEDGPTERADSSGG